MKPDLRTLKKEIQTAIVGETNAKIKLLVKRLVDLALSSDCTPRESILAIQVLLQHGMPTDGVDESTVVYPEEFHRWLAERHSEYEKNKAHANAPGPPPQLLLDIPAR